MSDDTLVEQADGVLTVTFNRPHRKNALNAANWNDLDAAVRRASGDPEVRAVVLTGAGGNFSAGADLSGDGGGAGLTGGPPQAILHEMRIVGEIVRRLQRLPKPTLALVDGVAVGVSLGLVLACDLIVASDRARFAEIFVRRGLALDGGTSWTLPRAVGIRRAKQMAFFGDMVPAAQALDWGLINEVVPADELSTVGAEWAGRLAAGPTTAISLIKRMLDDSALNSIEQSFEEEARSQHIAYTTADMHEGITAFIERRAARFTGR
jgi:2-(1,2-epoxy-1,2-dihydrophenyl)acetyl-CoA isomerase